MYSDICSECTAVSSVLKALLCVYRALSKVYRADLRVYSDIQSEYRAFRVRLRLV